MTIHYNATDRKPLVQTISEITGCKATYMKTPTYAYEIGPFTVTKEGNVTIPDSAYGTTTEEFIAIMTVKGFIAETVTFDDPDMERTTDTAIAAEDTGLTVTIPLDKVNVGNLNNLLESKGKLIQQALDIPALPITITEDTISFPWFNGELEPVQVDTYSRFIAALCKMSIEQKRISKQEKPVDNAKYTFRCFLLRLGFIGSEYKTQRKILLAKLPGSSAFKSGNPKVQEMVDQVNSDTELYDEVMSLQDGGEEE